MDRDDKFPDLFSDLIYTLLLQLSSSRGPEAASPILKTWRLIHTGTLPEEINLQRHGAGGAAGGGEAGSGGGDEALGLGWTGPRAASQKSLDSKSRRHERASSSPPGGEKFPEADHTHDSPLLRPARRGVQSLRTRSLTRSPLRPLARPAGVRTPAHRPEHAACCSEEPWVLPAEPPHRDMVPPSSRITIRSMQLLFRRLGSEQLVHTLDDQGVWALLQSSSTFLQGVGLLARWVPGLPLGRGGTC